MLRKPVFWLALALASLAGVFFTVRYFSQAYPIVALNLRMDRGQALARAREIAARLKLPPDDFREAASFAGDSFVQAFIELEGGGAEVLRSMIASGLYQPYTWTVRHFRPGETRESSIRFTPEGIPHGFAVKLPENEPGAALGADQARQIAEQGAVAEWKLDLSNLQIAEVSREVRPSGRVDHTFTYERSDAHIGEGRYRLRLVVSGSRLTELNHFVRVPEAFSRRYQEMRSANDFIGMMDAAAVVLLYFLGGCGIGLFFLLRKRWIQWRAPLIWGVGIALLQLLAGVNEWPLSWMGYDTALSPQSFTAQRLAQIVLLFLLYAVLFSISFMAAESLSRRAFPRHIQQWRLWSSGIAASRAVLGRTVGGYLLVGLFLAYDVFLYLNARRLLGWWTPSDALVQPDVLSSYFPWLSSIAVSAQAGFWEESLFRAVPIAGAALLGDRFGKRRYWIAAALIMQALVFGAGHAGYMNQPAYARLVELIVPSLAFGALYILFGLLPGIVLHFSIDVVWLSLPLFVSAAPGIWVDRTLVILAALLPLWVVVGARLRAKKWQDAAPSCLNLSWHPPESAPAGGRGDRPVSEYRASTVLRRSLPVMGLLGLFLWWNAGRFKSDAPPLAVDLSQAESLARQALEANGVHLPRPWQALAAVEAQPGQEDRFVWQKAGESTYKNLMGQYLTPPHWKIRFVRFEGEVAGRAEEYQVFVSEASGAFRTVHILAEGAAGSSLSLEEARRLVHEALRQQFRRDPASLKEVSAVSTKLKARIDWKFTYADAEGSDLSPGEKRIAVQVAGNTVTDAYRFVHVPEDWARLDRERQVFPSIIQLSCLALLVLILLAGAVAAIVAWSRKRFAVTVFLWVFAALLGIRILDLWNSFPSLQGLFSTAQPYKLQVFTIVTAGLLAALALAGCAGLLAGYVAPAMRERQKNSPDHDAPGIRDRGFRWRFAADLRSVIPGASLGCAAAGLTALALFFGRSLTPLWADYGPPGAYLPLVKSALGPLDGYLVQGTGLLLVLVSLDAFTGRWIRRKSLSGAMLVLMGFVVAGASAAPTVNGWLAAGATTGVFLLASYLISLRFSLQAALFAAGIFGILGALREGMAASYPHAVSGAIAASLLVAAAALCLGRILAGPSPSDSASGQ